MKSGLASNWKLLLTRRMLRSIWGGGGEKCHILAAVITSELSRRKEPPFPFNPLCLLFAAIPLSTLLQPHFTNDFLHVPFS